MEQNENVIWLGEERQNQFCLILEKCLYLVLHLIVNYSCLAVHYTLLPYIFSYEFAKYGITQSWKIAKAIYKDVKEFFHVVPMITELIFWFYVITFETILCLKKSQEINYDVEMKVYRPLKRILKMLNALPLPTELASALYSVFKRLPIFGKTIPFPSFLFERTFKRVTFKEGVITIVPRELPENESSDDSFTKESRQHASTQTSPHSALSELTPGIIKRKKSLRRQNPENHLGLQSISDSGESDVAAISPSVEPGEIFKIKNK